MSDLSGNSSHNYLTSALYFQRFVRTIEFIMWWEMNERGRDIKHLELPVVVYQDVFTRAVFVVFWSWNCHLKAFFLKTQFEDP